MTELIIGNGFIGQTAYEAFATDGHEVHQASRRPESHPNSHYMDLSRPDTIATVLAAIRPEVVVNCAAITGRNENDQVSQNPILIRNLLEGALSTGFDFSRIVTLGSAAEYGPVDEDALPISEDASLNPNNPYAQSKKEETNTALQLATEHDLPVVVARIFNPLGPALHHSNLAPRIISQIKAVRAGEQEPTIRVRDLEASRDYLHIADCVNAIGVLAHSQELPYRVYNVGSGKRTSNHTLIRSVLRHTSMSGVGVAATETKPEPLVGAAQADISRLLELGWTTHKDLDEAVYDMVAAAGLTAESHDVG